MKASVYIETTVVSYLVARPTQDKLKAARQRITREWWAKQQQQFDCFVSETVIQEISAGEAVMSAKWTGCDASTGMARWLPRSAPDR